MSGCGPPCAREGPERSAGLLRRGTPSACGGGWGGTQQVGHVGAGPWLLWWRWIAPTPSGPEEGGGTGSDRVGGGSAIVCACPLWCWDGGPIASVMQMRVRLGDPAHADLVIFR